MVWDNATLDWNPGSQTLTATYEGKKAYGKRDMVPTGLHDKLFEKKKLVTAKVIVQQEGNDRKIVKIEK